MLRSALCDLLTYSYTKIHRGRYRGSQRNTERKSSKKLYFETASFSIFYYYICKKIKL